VRLPVVRMRGADERTCRGLGACTPVWCGSPDCLPKSCPNAPVCGAELVPRHHLDARTQLCVECSTRVGKVLVFVRAADECPVCLTHAPGLSVRMPGCSHSLCTQCAPRVLSSDDARCPMCRASAQRGWGHRHLMMCDTLCAPNHSCGKGTVFESRR
jgi:hypothetical protein